MLFYPALCPVCGALACQREQLALVSYPLVPTSENQEVGVYEPCDFGDGDDESTVHDQTAESSARDSDLEVLGCGQGHTWEAAIVEDGFCARTRAEKLAQLLREYDHCKFEADPYRVPQALPVFRLVDELFPKLAGRRRAMVFGPSRLFAYEQGLTVPFVRAVAGMSTCVEQDVSTSAPTSVVNTTSSRRRPGKGVPAQRPVEVLQMAAVNAGHLTEDEQGWLAGFCNRKLADARECLVFYTGDGFFVPYVYDDAEALIRAPHTYPDIKSSCPGFARLMTWAYTNGFAALRVDGGGVIAHGLPHYGVR